MNIILLGGTKGMGRALARALAARGDRLVLLGRNLEDLERSAADLAVRADRQDAVAAVALCDLARRETFEPALEEAWAVLGSVDAVVVTAGLFDTQDHLEEDPEALETLLDIDFTATILFSEAARRRLMAQSGGGTLCVFSSVAGERGRKPTVLYGAAKAGLSAYLEGLDHRWHGEGLRVVNVKPGFVHTSMTAGLKAPPFAGQPEGVARDVIRALDQGKPVLFTPWPWRWVMAIIRRLPRAIMRRVGF